MVIMTTHFAGLSQKSTDTLCLERPQIIKLLKRAQEARVHLERITILETDVKILNERIAEKELMIQGYREQDSLNNFIINTYMDEIQAMFEQRKILEDVIASHKKEVRRLKRQLFWTRAAGVLLLGGGAYLYITK